MSEAFRAGEQLRVVRGDGATDYHGFSTGDVVRCIRANAEYVAVAGRKGPTSGWDADRFVRDVATQPSEATQLRQLLQAFEAIGPNARQLLIEIAGRLVKGAKEHGDFDPSAKRDWSREALEEDLDSIVYRALELQQRGTAK